MRRFLTDAELVAILASRATAPQIAAAHDIARETVYAVKRLKTQKARRVAGAMSPSKAVTWPPAQRRRPKLTRADVRAIRASSDPSAVLAHRYGVSASMIRMVKTGRTYK